MKQEPRSCSRGLGDWSPSGRAIRNGSTWQQLWSVTPSTSLWTTLAESMHAHQVAPVGPVEAGARASQRPCAARMVVLACRSVRSQIVMSGTTEWLGVALGAWGAGLSSVLGYRTVRAERRRLDVSVGWFSQLNDDDGSLDVGFAVRSVNLGSRPVTVRYIIFDTGHKRGFGSSPWRSVDFQSSDLPIRLEEGDSATHLFVYEPRHEEASSVTVHTETGQEYRVPLPLGGQAGPVLLEQARSLLPRAEADEQSLPRSPASERSNEHSE
jgi:hypothetical protein